MNDFVQKCSDVLLRQLDIVVTEFTSACAEAGGDLAVVETAVERAIRRTRGIMLDVGVQAAVDRNRRTRLCPECGQMESSIKQLSTDRLCGGGVKWSKEGADAALCVRAAHLSGELRETGKRQHQTLLKAAERYDREPLPKAA